ncbi:NUDIX hydrolase domain-like protein [Pyrenochaeta sp. MPI-SDFR-AT-0127]|nr:NUDIX hydrolase domain-like protein [Pyrenochaeta sp. MPI-SDFR-AT-0127]
MSTSTSLLYYPSTLEEWAVTEKEYLRQHPEYDCVCTGVVVFNEDGKLLLVQRAANEMAFPDFWEIPGGKVDDTDETILHAAARELKEEAGLEATRVVRRVTQFTFVDGRPGKPTKTWLKLIFEMEVQNIDNIVLEPTEHQHHTFASEEEVTNDLVKDIKLVYISPPNKAVKLEAFRLRREGLSS